MQLEPLPWDSAFFGFPVARMALSASTEYTTVGLQHSLQRRGVQLAYCFSPTPLDFAGAHECLMDEKTTFVKQLSVDASIGAVSDQIHTYQGEPPLSELESLAVQSGVYSRFAHDPRIPREKFEAMYKTWLRRSVEKVIAREVLVAQADGLAGLITLGGDQPRGDIGLLAVAEAQRGQGFATLLIAAAEQWFIQQGYQALQVVTQGRNLPACALYQHAGFAVEQVQYVYHFWGSDTV